MATYSQRVNASLDNGYLAGSWFSGVSNTRVGKAFAGNNVESAYRFTGVNIPGDATINSAKITLTGGANDAVSVNSKLSGIAEDNTANFSSDPTGRSKTTANVSWNFASGVSLDTAYDSPSLVAIIQEIIQRGGWSSGNSIGFIHEDNGSTADHILDFYGYDGSSTKCALLVIDWSSSTSTSTTTTTSTSTSTSTTTTSTTTTTLPPEPVLHGLKVFKPNAPSTLEPKNFFLNSKYKMLKIHQQGAFTSTYIRSVGLSLNISFPGLNYRPIVLVYMQRMNHDGNLDTDYHLLEWSYWGASKVGFQSVKVYNNKFVVDYQDNLVDDLAINFAVKGYFYVFREEIKE